MTKQEFLRSISDGIASAKDSPISGWPLFLLGFFILTLVSTVLIIVNRRRLSAWAIRIRKRIKGELINTERYKVKAEVSLNLPGLNGELIRSVTTNLSRNGMFVKLNPPLQLGEKLRFHLFLDEKITISGSAEVRWVQDGWSEHHPSGIGVKFLDLTQEYENQIRLWLQRRKPKKAS